jgi:hypothetical protein
MRVKGNKVSDSAIEISLAGKKELSAAKIDRGDRGSVVKKENIANEKISKVIRFSVSPQWSEVKGEVVVKFKNPDLSSALLDGKDGELTWGTAIRFNLAPGSGALYIDDMKLIEK